MPRPICEPCCLADIMGVLFKLYRPNRKVNIQSYHKDNVTRGILKLTSDIGKEYVTIQKYLPSIRGRFN